LLGYTNISWFYKVSSLEGKEAKQKKRKRKHVVVFVDTPGFNYQKSEQKKMKQICR
jgi:hypothetical protein